MPYIKDENGRRKQIDKIVTFIGENLDILSDKITDNKKIKQVIDLMLEVDIQVNGDLNYLLYALCKRYIKPSYNNYKKYITKLYLRNHNLTFMGDLPEILYGFYFNYVNGHEKEEYKRVNNLIGELECCVFEIYRRLIAPYEQKKIIENGDVE